MDSGVVVTGLDVWLFINHLNNIVTLRRLVEFYANGHNQRMPHSATIPDELAREDEMRAPATSVPIRYSLAGEAGLRTCSRGRGQQLLLTGS